MAVAMDANQLHLKGLELQLTATAGALRPQVLGALARHGTPLRWAITACCRQGGQRLLSVEAVVLAESSQAMQP